MTDSPSDLARFVVRKGTVRNTWMVWDRNIRGPAKTSEGPAVGLSEEQAHRVKARLLHEHGH
jgi:hypothetical protein